MDWMLETGGARELRCRIQVGLERQVAEVIRPETQVAGVWRGWRGSVLKSGCDRETGCRSLMGLERKGSWSGVARKAGC